PPAPRPRGRRRPDGRRGVPGRDPGRRGPGRRRHRAAHRRPDRRLRRRPAKGPLVSDTTTAAIPSAAGGRATSIPMMGRDDEPTIFELSVPGRAAATFRSQGLPEWGADELVPAAHLAEAPLGLTE